MDFINNLPPSMREELELQQTPDMQRELKIKMKKFLDMESIERQENEDWYSKASKANDDQKEHITQKEYYNRYKEVIDLCLTNTPQKSISLKTGYTLKRIQYIWSRYKNAPQN